LTMTMKPRVLKIDPHNIDLRLIQEAADAIKRGELVAFPTETVYGLGANAFDAKAVSRIFEAKKKAA
jgi:L-threonylcarbamoyladenylate synthase